MRMLRISEKIIIPDNEIQCDAIRAQGAGGQNVNKVSSAIHLRFDINNSSLPGIIKEKLLSLKDSRISKDGVIVIKAQKFRKQEKNREDALGRLKAMILKVLAVRRKRRSTKPSKNSVRKRLDTKKKHGKLKQLRGRVSHE